MSMMLRSCSCCWFERISWTTCALRRWHSEGEEAGGWAGRGVGGKEGKEGGEGGGRRGRREGREEGE